MIRQLHIRGASCGCVQSKIDAKIVVIGYESHPVQQSQSNRGRHCGQLFTRGYFNELGRGEYEYGRGLGPSYSSEV